MPCPERVRTMRRRTFRAVAAVLLVAVLLPAALPAEEISFLPLTPGERSFASGLWDLLRVVFLGEETGSSATSGLDSVTAACDNGWQIDPNGGDACATDDNRWQIDPNG